MMDLDKIPFIPTAKFTTVPHRPVDLIVVHSTEGHERSGSARSVAAWFASLACPASAHYVVDPEEVVCCVRDHDVAWHAGHRRTNERSIGIELCGTAAQSEAEWADEDSAAILIRAARLCSVLCALYDIPITTVPLVDLAHDVGRGFVTHAMVSQTHLHGGHWDPGPRFPWEAFLAEVLRPPS